MSHRIRVAAYVALALVAGCGRPPAIVGEISIELNPSGRVPLAGSLSFTTDQPARVTLAISDGENESVVAPLDAYAIEHELMVLGLRPGRVNTVEVRVENERGQAGEPRILAVETPPLPDNFPPIDVTVSRPARMEPGITLIPAERNVGQEPDREWGLVLAIDAQGDVVWYYETDHGIDEPRRLRNGNLLYRTYREYLTEIDMLGNVVSRWAAAAIPRAEPLDGIPVDTDTFHHDVVEMPSGNFLALSTEARRFESYATSLEDPDADWAPADVIGDVLVEFRRDGTKVREWSFFDLLDPYRLGYGSLETGFYEEAYSQVLENPGYDWSHGNGLYYDTEGDAAIVSSNHLSVVFELDLATGEIEWMLGNAVGWSEPWSDLLLEAEDGFRWPYHQHAPELTPQGTLLIYDNGASQAMPPDPPVLPPETYSRAVEYRIDEENGAVSEVWSYGGPGEEWFFSGFVSEADWLPQTGNVLITNGGRIRKPDGSPGVGPGDGHFWVTIAEVTHTEPAEKVWEVVIDDPAAGWITYRSERLPSLYP